MSRIRLFFIGVTLFFLVSAGVAWLLSNQGIIPNSWTLPLETTFSVLGVLFAFFQWVLPLSSSDPKLSSAGSSPAQEMFHKQISDRLTGENGALIVYEKRSNVGANMELGYGRIKANIVGRTVGGRPLVAAVFPNIKPDNYHVSGPGGSEYITVPPGQIIEIDWRQNRQDHRGGKEYETKQKRRRIDLRVNSFFIGLGGAVFLAQRYFVTPYRLDIAGAIFMALGIVNLLSSFVLDWFDWRKGGYLRFSVFIIESGGAVFLAQRYFVTPYRLDIAGILLLGLGVVNLLSTSLFGWFDWFREGGHVFVFGVELGILMILFHRYLMIPYIDIAGFILIGLGAVICIIGVIMFIIDS